MLHQGSESNVIDFESPGLLDAENVDMLHMPGFYKCKLQTF